MIATIMSIASKAAISMLMSLATEKFFTEIFIMLAEKAAKSTKTPWAIELVDIIKKGLEDGKK